MVSVPAAGANAAPQPSNVTNAAQGGQATPQTITPGSVITIYGNAMAAAGAPLGPSGPLLNSWNGAQVSIGGPPFPLLYASPTQINGVGPNELDNSGSGPGAIQIATTALVAGPAGNGARPAVRGTDYLEICCTGLGPLQPAGGKRLPPMVR